jgi:hypothetical protein
VIVHVLILWGVISAAAALGVVVHRRTTGDDTPEYQSAFDFRRGGLRPVVGSVGGLHYATRPAGRVVALGSAAVLMTVTVGVLGMLDQPFGVGVRVQPDEMRQAVDLVLIDEHNPAILRPCR